MPVVPVYHIIQLINERYGTKFNLGSHLGIGEASSYTKENEVVEKGVVPLVGLDLTYDNRYMRRAILSGMRHKNVDITITLDDGEVQFYDMIAFTQIAIQKDDFLKASGFRYCEPTSVSGEWVDNVGVTCAYDNVSLEVDGCITACFLDIIATSSSTPEETPCLSIYQIQRYYPNNLGSGARWTNRAYYKWVELGSVDGEQVGTNSGYVEYKFDFASENGATRMALDDLAGTDKSASPIIFAFNYRMAGTLFTMQKDIEIFIINNDKVTQPHPIDIVGNLPDISCLSFMKSLFFMMGAYPYVTNDGSIVARCFSEIEENVVNGNAINWDSKALSDINDGNEEIEFAQSDFAQKNYYMMKSDDLDHETDPDEEEVDVFENGIGCIEVENSTLDVSKTVIQLPFYAPYIQNCKFPYFDTGNTMKAWTLEKNDSDTSRASYLKEFCTPNPIIGIIKDRDYGYSTNDGAFVKVGVKMTIETWNGFVNMDQNPSFVYLGKIIRQPFIVTEELRLNEFDLKDLDYTIPVYLSKYNSYFAIVSIKRDSNGMCECELIKLP